MAMLDLPNELVVLIVSNLTHRDLVACQLSNKQLYTIIKDSVLLQFQIALSTFKATDNPSCSLNIAERFQALKDYEDAWSYLRKDFERTINVNYDVSGIYDLTGGVFFLGNAARTALHYIKLPSSIEDHVDWRKIQLDHDEGTIIDMGLCLYEHDLLVVVTSKQRHGFYINTYDINLVLLQLSTGKPHPAAKENTILVVNLQWDSPGICVEIVGDHLVLILSYTSDLSMAHDRVFVYDWRNALQKMSFEAPYCSYSGLVFLSEKLVVIPNTRGNALEIWDISSTSITPRPACILQLPELANGNTLAYITCRGEPNPIGSQSHGQPQSHRPFSQSAYEAIILFHIRVQLRDPVGHQQQHGGELALGHTYTLFVHRKALCEVYERHCADMNDKLEDVLGIPDVFGQPEDSGPGLDETMVDGDVSPGWESMGSDDEDDIPIKATNDGSIHIPWSSWGPPITCSFITDDHSTEWITTTSGQRAVLISQFPPYGVGQRYVVLDFNLENVRRMEKKLVPPHFGFYSRIQCSRNMKSIMMEGVFKYPVVGELPFVSCTSKKNYVWGGALMDEERVLGIQLDNDGHIRDIEVHHFGGAQKQNIVQSVTPNSKNL